MQKQKINAYYEAEGKSLKKSDIDRYYRGFFRFVSTHGCRNRVIEKWLNSTTPGESFLDVGCEWGYQVRRMAKKGLKATGVDISPTKVRKAQLIADTLHIDCAFMVQDAEKLEFADNSFDWVLCTETLEHLLNDQGAAQELVRMARKFIVISVPQKSIFWRFINNLAPVYGFKTTGAGHLREYTVESLLQLFNGSVQVLSIAQTGYIVSFLDRFLPNHSLFKSVICLKLKKK
ncbi:MAG: class I SAM-dependent methyltransferase [Candidatus Helarchaeota archaeon]|nr:class I SAM-dependent methyltransferase [Candidatus Helarchaeota archaeon]